jgi:2-phosphoglycolate phosphatase
MSQMPFAPTGVLFDLDGTLLDSAPDLYAALVEQCVEEGVPPPPYALVREVVSRGSCAILREGFADAEEEAISARVPRYLTIYESLMARHTKSFDGIDALLACLDAQGIRWGIVTNRPGYLTEALLARLDLGWNTVSVVSGDTLPVAKPDPAPVLHACREGGLNPLRSVFVGDDRRDVLAGNAAGLYTVAVTWGYLDGGNPHDWGADAVVDSPAALARLLGVGEVVA